MMTDRLNCLTVVLENDMRTDDAEALINAIGQLRGVLSVEGGIADLPTHIAEMRVRRELGDKIWGILYPNREK